MKNIKIVDGVSLKLIQLRILRTGGRATSIVPDSVLFDSSNPHKAIRKKNKIEKEQKNLSLYQKKKL